MHISYSKFLIRFIRWASSAYIIMSISDIFCWHCKNKLRNDWFIHSGRQVYFNRKIKVKLCVLIKIKSWKLFYKYEIIVFWVFFCPSIYYFFPKRNLVDIQEDWERFQVDLDISRCEIKAWVHVEELSVL